ncbi:MAG: hypothetical protein Q9216_003219 [Gyalolechia sp. 2 TL-2023]
MTSSKRDIAYDLIYYQSNLEPYVEMSISIQDQQRIFLAYRALFEGQNAQVRQPKKIRNILISSKTSSSPLVQSIGFDKVVTVLRGLLERKVFSSELKAKLAFPILYETSPEQNARHEASDAGAAKEEAEALQEVEALDNAVVDEDTAGVLEFGDADMEETAAVNGFGDPAMDNQYYPDTDQRLSAGIPSLYPVQFPFRVQYSILARSQRLLEECCYDFTQKYAPDVLVEKRWDCAEAIELNKWTFAMMKKHGKLPAGAFKESSSGIHKILFAVNRLRHSAVHRLRISAKGILQIIHDAVRFAETLSDSARASQLEELYKELQSMIKSQELNKNYLETKLKDELDEIKRQREELVEREQKAISTIVVEDGDNTKFVGSLLERRLRSILDGYHSDDELHDSDPQDGVDNVEAQADENPYKEYSPERQEPSKPASNGNIPCDEIECEEIAKDLPCEPYSELAPFNEATLEEVPPFDEPQPAEEFPPVEECPPVEEFPPVQEFPPIQEFPPVEEATPVEEPQPAEEFPPVAEPQLVESLSTEPASTEPRAETTMNGTTELPIMESPKKPVRQVSIADIIQNMLRSQEIDTAALREKSKSKTKTKRKRYEAELKGIKGAVAENLRHQLENVLFGNVVSEQIKEFLEQQDIKADLFN